MKKSTRILSLLLVLMLVLPIAAQAKTNEEKIFHQTEFAVSFRADTALSAPVADLLNALSVSGIITNRRSNSNFDINIMLNGKESTRTDAQILLAEKHTVISSSLLGSLHVLLAFQAAAEYASKMNNHMGAVEFSAAALCIPYVTEKAFRRTNKAIQPVLFASGEDRTIPAADLVKLAKTIASYTEKDRTLSYWLAAVYAVSPEIGVRLYALAEELPELVAELLAEGDVTVTVADGVQTFACGETVLMACSGAGLRLNLLLGSQKIDLDYQAEDCKVNLQWQDAGETVLDLQLTASGIPEKPYDLSDVDVKLNASGLAIGAEPVQITFVGAVNEDTTCSFVLNRNGLDLLTVSGIYRDLGTISEYTFVDPEDSLAFFSLADTSLKGLIDEIKEPFIRGALPLLAEMPGTTVAAMMDFLEKGGVFDMAANSFDKLSGQKGEQTEYLEDEPDEEDEEAYDDEEEYDEYDEFDEEYDEALYAD